MRSNFSAFILGVILLLGGCTFTEEGKRIFSQPDFKPFSKDEDLLPLTFVTSHGIKSQLFPHKEYTKKSMNSKWPVFLKVGGVEYLSSYLDIFKKRFSQHFILIETGDVFSSKDDKLKTELLLSSLDHLKFDAVGLGLEGIKKLKRNPEVFDKHEVPFIATNLIDIKSSESLNSKKLFPYKIIEKKGVKIAILSMLPYDIISLKDKKDLAGLYFKDLIASFLATKNKLKKENASIFVLMLKTNSNCEGVLRPHSQMSADQLNMVCYGQDLLEKFVKRLPPNSIDLIITSGKIIGSGFLNGVPVANSWGEGKFLSQTTLFFSANRKQVLSQMTRFHAPIKICHRFFVSTEDCYVEKENIRLKGVREELLKKTAFDLVPARLLGHEIKKDEEVTSILTNK